MVTTLIDLDDYTYRYGDYTYRYGDYTYCYGDYTHLQTWMTTLIDLDDYTIVMVTTLTYRPG